MEEWKVHPIYFRIEVSNHGNVRCSKTGRPRYVGTSAKGYRVLGVKVSGKRIELKVHRLVCELFLDPPNKEIVDECSKHKNDIVYVNHKDGDKANNHYSNLEWCTPRQNSHHAKDIGLLADTKGTLNGRAVLTEDMVHDLCKAFEEGMQPKEASEVFGVSRQQASKIRAGIAWKHIWEQYDIKVNRHRARINGQS